MGFMSEERREFCAEERQGVAAAAGVLEAVGVEHDALGAAADRGSKWSRTRSSAITLAALAAGGGNCPWRSVRAEVADSRVCGEVRQTRWRSAGNRSVPLHGRLIRRAE